jgi:membrane-associated phospholipid phosphatase
MEAVVSRITHLGHELRYAQIWVGVLLSATALTFLIYLLWDEPVRQWLLVHPSTWHEQAWVDAFRQLGKAYIPIWLLLVWSCLTNCWRPTVITLVALLLVGLSVCSLKAVAARRRPNDPARISLELSASELGHSWRRGVSFPSGDTAAAFAVATVLAFTIRRAWAVLFVAAAGAIGLLRVTALVHYPSDVFAGMTIGVLAGWGSVHWVLRRLPEMRFALKGRWRILLGVLLVVLVPLVGPRTGMAPLLVFLRFYGPAAGGLLLLGTLVQRKRLKATPTRPHDRLIVSTYDDGSGKSGVSA